METFEKWFATSPVASAVRVFFAIVIAMFIADGADVFSVDTQDRRLWIAVAFSSALPALIRWLNPADPSFGPTK